MVLKEKFFSQLSCGKDNKNNSFEIGLILIFATVTLIGILNHAMWRDELNGWLIARDSYSFINFFKNIKYEGHPVLWYLCLWILNQITANPIMMQIFHWLIAVTTIAIFILFSPFTQVQKALFTFGYLPVYEYSLISRNYSIGALSIFLFCACFKTRHQSYLTLAFILAMMANTNAYCLLISLALAFTLVIEYIFRGYFQYETKANQYDLTAALIIFLIGIVISVFMLLPPSDSTLQGGANQWFFYFDFNRLTQTLTRIWRSYILVIIPSDSKPLDLFIFSFFSLGLFGFSILMLIRKPIALLFYSIGSLEILAFTYAKFLGSERHYGHLYIILIAALWIGNYYANSQIIINFLNNISYRFSRIVCHGANFVSYHKKYFLLIILWLQVIAGIVAFSRDLITPYSSSKMTAEFIQSNNLSEHFIMGSEDFTIAPISGYLEQKIYYPEAQKMGSYVLFNNERKIVDDTDIINQMSQIIANDNKDILLILNREFLDSSQDLKIQFIEKFTQSFIYNEKYYLYLVKSSSKSS
ncbi:conserved hypothetical protein [Crocosphaera subtropica ATCC 51142]|uniref:Glycosyltransferase RgtA/B/C/D-like domain-containing protein n=1 Tax=Crocosphaera subtropica (strain ATCC 51142 / BH68) TaxID=43989 RepID=B1WRF4_CROS5|nr:hypothetical protein [Crocosphaera subtropica]ACB51803.1 conserved hypothetical protein [Crocosphaera subtropica ATCC 51142]